MSLGTEAVQVCRLAQSIIHAHVAVYRLGRIALTNRISATRVGPSHARIILSSLNKESFFHTDVLPWLPKISSTQTNFFSKIQPCIQNRIPIIKSTNVLNIKV